MMSNDYTTAGRPAGTAWRLTAIPVSVAAAASISPAGAQSRGAVSPARMQELQEQALEAVVESLRAAAAREEARAMAEELNGNEAQAARHREMAERLMMGMRQAQERSGTAMAQAGTPTPPAPPPPPIPEIPAGAVVMTLALFATIVLLALGVPLARAFLRRANRQAAPAVPDAATQAQLRDIGLAVEAIAIEVERIGESQRNLDRLYSGVRQ
jgi:hypothetical protein